MDDQDGDRLTEHCEPAQPHQRIEAHIPWPVMRLGQPEHGANVAIGAS